MPQRGFDYARQVVNRDLISCELEYLACLRFLEDLEKENFPYVFDITRAEKIIEFFEKYCRHVKGIFEGETIELHPFQVFDLINIFGWVKKTNGARRFTRAFIEEARGNAKSAVMSGVALYGMTADCIYPPNQPKLVKYEANPHVECCAYDREQARIIWKDACEMAKISTEISSRLEVKKTYVIHKTRGGHLKALSKDTKNKDGKSISIAIADEIHVWKTSEIMDIILSGFGKRSQNLFCAITTAGQDAENSVGKKEHDICAKILNGDIVDETYFCVIRQLDIKDDPHDSSLWVKANPMLRYDNLYIDDLRSTIQQNHDIAYGSGDPSKIREFLIKRCCLWQVDAENKYMSGIMDKWKALAISKEEFKELTKNKSGWAGLDLSKSTDLTADAFTCWLDDGRLAVTAHGYMPEQRATQHEHSDRVPYKQWASDGWCTLTEGSVTDYIYIKNNFIEREFEYNWTVKEFCFDPYNATHFTQDLTRSGYTEEQMVEIRQGVQTLSEPTKKLRELILQGKVVHDGSPLLTWCLSNAIEIIDNNGNIKLSKKHKDDSQRIDLAAAVINALVRAMVNEVKEPSCPYNTDRGILML